MKKTKDPQRLEFAPPPSGMEAVPVVEEELVQPFRERPKVMVDPRRSVPRPSRVEIIAVEEQESASLFAGVREMANGPRAQRAVPRPSEIGRMHVVVEEGLA